MNTEHQNATSKLLLVDACVLPEVFEKVVEAKRLLAVGIAKNLSDAAKTAGISRSAFYKYCLLYTSRCV